MQLGSISDIRHPEEPEQREGLEGRKLSAVCVLRGSLTRAPQDDEDRVRDSQGART
jgi:hypothetical protein